MKTPRDLLLAQHRAAESKLDALRRNVVNQCRDGRPASPSEGSDRDAAENLLSLLWRELIFPSRRLWTGVAAAWVAILLVHLSLRDPAATGSQKVYAPAMMSLQDQQKLLNALFTDRGSPVEVDRPKPFVPRPSGERTAVMTS